MTEANWLLAGYGFSIYTAFLFLTGILMLLQGVFVLYQNFRSQTHVAFLLVTLSCFIWLTGTALEVSAPLEISNLWMRFYTNYGVFLIAPSVYFFSVAFSRIRSPVRHQLVWLGYALAVLFSILLSSTNLIFSGMQRFYWGFWPKPGSLRSLYHFYFTAYYAASMWNFFQAFRSETNPKRKKQFGMLILAFSVALFGSMDYLPEFGLELLPLGFVFIISFVFVMFYSMIQYQLLDIETVIHKTIGWFLTSVALVSPLAATLYFTRSWYSALNPIHAGGYLGGLLMLFLVFVKYVHPKVDHFFQRGRYDMENVLDRFSDEVVHLRGLGELVQKITDTITNTLYAGRVIFLLYSERTKKLVTAVGVRDALKSDFQMDAEHPFLKWLCQNDRILRREFLAIDPRYEPVRREAEEYVQALDAVLCVPLVLNEKLIGLINLGRKMNLKSYSGRDSQFLSRLKNQATIALSNSLVYGRVEEMVKIRTEELIETQKQLIQAEKLATVGTLAGGVAHEINNPLTAILTNAQMLLLTVQDADEKASLELIEEASQRCREIVRKLMTYSRKPFGGREVTEVDLEQVVHSVIAFLGFNLTQDNINVNTKFENCPLIVKGNQNELEQVFTNLILNARDAIFKIKKKGEIAISISGTAGDIIVQIQDDGVGIAGDHISKIFDPFFTTKEVGKGTGLGLSICQSIVDQHHGTIEVKSERDHGTTFTIKLPRLTAGAGEPSQ